MGTIFARTIRILKKPVIFSPIIFGIGYGTGMYNEKRISAKPENAINIIQNQPELTWRLKYFSSSNQNQSPGRDGLWVTRFKPRHTGAIAYVLFHEKKTGQSYLLLTLQERIIQQKKCLVCEPPIGFFNGEYPASTPHAVSEAAEREIEKQYKQGAKNVDQRKIYTEFLTQYHQGKLTGTQYKVDANLQDTAYREIEEEAGLNLTELQKSGLAVSQTLLGEKESPDVYASIRRVDIWGDVLPKLQKRDNDEIKHNEWIPISNIDLKTGSVKTSKGIFPLKPYDGVKEYTEKVISNIPNKSPSIKK